MSPSPDLLEQGPLGEKTILTPNQTKHRRDHVTRKMPSARRFFLTLCLGLLVTAGLANALLKQQPSDQDAAESEPESTAHRDDSAFSRLLSSASPQALHHFLHTYFPATYKHGIYDSDHAAIEAVHANDPELATSIVQMAKRQSGNETTAAVTTSTSTETSAATSTSASSASQETTTADSSSTSVPSTTDVTTVTATSSATSATSTQPDSQTTTSTSESTGTTSTPSSTLSTTTTTGAATTTSPRTSTFTSTLPGGAKTTITSVEVVAPGTSEAASSTSGTSGSLQSGVGMPLAGNPVVEAIIGVVVGGALLI